MKQTGLNIFSGKRYPALYNTVHASTSSSILDIEREGERASEGTFSGQRGKKLRFPCLSPLAPSSRDLPSTSRGDAPCESSREWVGRIYLGSRGSGSRENPYFPKPYTIHLVALGGWVGGCLCWESTCMALWGC